MFCIPYRPCFSSSFPHVIHMKGRMSLSHSHCLQLVCRRHNAHTHPRNTRKVQSSDVNMSCTCLPPHAPLLRIAPVNDATQEFPTLLTTETPHHQRTETWCLRTGTPYHPFDAVVNLTHKSIECPQCTWGLSVGKSFPSVASYSSPIM